MRIFPLLFLTSLLLIAGCEKDEMAFRSQPEMPETVLIDVDKDGEIDFFVRYSKLVSSDSIMPKEMIGYLVTEGNHAIFRKEDESPLFLKDLQVMDYFVEPPYYWQEPKSPYSATVPVLIKIDRFEEPNRWPLTWDILSDTIEDSYLIGVKIRDLGGSELMGYIEIAIDEVSGQITLLEAELL